MKKGEKQIYTVSQLNLLIKELLENNLPGRLGVRGEITDWKLHHSGHCYFSLKDEDSKLPCVMWRSKYRKVKFELENGISVIATGYIDVYPPHGKYQLYVESMQPAGKGSLQLAFEQMVKRLQGQGLFDERHKQALPKYPERIAVLTSESGAAIGDIVNSIHNRWPCVKILLYPVPVQGEGAAEKIAAGVREINRRNKELEVDLLIVGRGGGSLEDLWAFNEEAVARAIYDSQIPVISAVGHEINTSIADLVADARASTPTKAGVAAVPDIQEVLEQLAGIKNRLESKSFDKLILARQMLETILASSVFRNPYLVVNNAAQRLDEITSRLAESLGQTLRELKEELAEAYEKVSKLEPHRLLGAKRTDMFNAENQLLNSIKTTVTNKDLELTAYENRLAGLNPKSVLKRGYSITKNKETGRLIKTPDDVHLNELITTELAKKKIIESKVMRK